MPEVPDLGSGPSATARAWNGHPGFRYCEKAPLDFNALRNRPARLLHVTEAEGNLASVHRATGGSKCSNTGAPCHRRRSLNNKAAYLRNDLFVRAPTSLKPPEHCKLFIRQALICFAEKEGRNSL